MSTAIRAMKGVRFDGDRARLAGLFARYYELTRHAMRRSGVAPDQVDDAAQETFIVLARKLDCIEPGRETSYILGTAARVAANQRRALRLRRIAPGADTEDLIDLTPCAEYLLDQKRRREMLEWALRLLSPLQREVFVLIEFEGLSITQAAGACGIAVGTAASRLRKARAALDRAVDCLRARSEFAARRARPAPHAAAPAWLPDARAA
jgi:RNA polymerase sigma-70 factor (ECF subfamily)